MWIKREPEHKKPVAWCSYQKINAQTLRTVTQRKDIKKNKQDSETENANHLRKESNG